MSNVVQMSVMKFFRLLLYFFVFPFCCHGQTGIADSGHEIADSIQLGELLGKVGHSSVDYVPATRDGVLPMRSLVGNPGAIFETGMTINPAAFTYPDFSFSAGQADLLSWHQGSFYATGASTGLPGLMGIEQGALNLSQSFGKFNLTVYGSAIKYGFFQGLETSYGFGGELTYIINDKTSVTMFGSYNSPIGITLPAMMGYVGVPTFGGYVNYRFHPHWGVKVGAQSYRSLVTRQWETQPIVMPYFRLGQNDIGIDLGGIIYELIKSATYEAWGKSGNPTISPPSQKMSDTFYLNIPR